MTAARLVPVLESPRGAIAAALLVSALVTSAVVAQPDAPEGRVGLRVEVDGGAAAWREAAAALASSPVVPEWVAEAAGSRPWNDRAPGFEVSARQPGPRGGLVGYSGLEADPESALVGARQEASRLVQALVLWSAKDAARRWRGDSARRALRVAAEQATVVVPSLEKAVHREAIARSYGRLHRAAVLIEVDPEIVDRLSNQLQHEIWRSEAARRAERDALWIRCGIGVALTIGLLVAMLAADMLTKGYFRWRVRALAALAIGLVWFAVILLPELT